MMGWRMVVEKDYQSVMDKVNWIQRMNMEMNIGNNWIRFRYDYEGFY